MSFSSSVMSFFRSLTARRSSRWVRPVSLAIRFSTLLRMLLPLVDIARHHPPSAPAPAPAASNHADGEAESAAAAAARRAELSRRRSTKTCQRSRGRTGAAGTSREEGREGGGGAHLRRSDGDAARRRLRITHMAGPSPGRRRPRFWKVSPRRRRGGFRRRRRRRRAINPGLLVVGTAGWVGL